MALDRKNACLRYVTGSTRLLDTNGAVLNALPDGVIGAGVQFGVVGVGTDQKRFVEFDVEVEAASAGTRCP